MMRAPLIPIAAALALAAACVAGGSAANEPPELAPIVDLFPAQSWTSLGAEAATDAELPPDVAPESDMPPLDTPIDVPPVASAPFDIAGEWRENGHRIVVLEGAGKTFLLCESRCGVRDAVQPGGEIAEGYRLKKLGKQGAVIVTRGSTDVELSPPVPTP
ncbi:hypothetical protein BLA39750_05398 [Burkholderia lata]|uniref:Lipoprotein n=1 Tax=Burkholderia lata (strain ATCC 17760 / DSM 23089 / LMG 22485 / NCIMB 9086 / R18194 / 383) TaxID=482957 RepID=A0A6P3AF63_BURL3|nr:hypothetical protein [Burkholderia lata]VWD41289.1 hypothetical protein BLA39750_05398 [Burkholderia lata]